ncbi:RNA-binding protein [Pseudomonas sp. N40(2020)]|uniref:RNA recognition motif domain-containing protein n=1 Tax=Pseudomonas sp. N40(2020) TaxID=2767798 RepID=UPI001656B84E|nr:RNA-binding protein [Pseudomonas sp. N40(2020)]MBC8994931.1 RNA-binding protein [Pseudomonas sp. N40(2020)]
MAVKPRTENREDLRTKIFVGGLSHMITSDSLKAKFEVYGLVVDAIIIFDRETGRSKGFGFVTYDDPLDAKSAVDNLNETEFEGRTIKVTYATE